MHFIRLTNYFLLVVLAALLGTNCTQVITMEKLLAELQDPLRATYFPQPEYQLFQASSYDRRSIKAGTPEWYANEDYTRFMRVDTSLHRREYVMMETEGPGAVVRWWMTFAGEGATKGILRIYLDHDSVAVLEDSVLHFMTGQDLIPYPFAASVAPQTDSIHRGFNLYWPVTFARHIKITLENPFIKEKGGRWTPSIYYNLNYRLYPPATRVHNFDPADLIRQQPAIKQAAEYLQHPPELTADSTLLQVVLAPGTSFQYLLSGTGVVSQIILISQRLTPAALRQVVIAISFDGRQTIWCPLGEFFGTGYQLSPYSSFFSRTEQNGKLVFSRMMPYRDSMRLQLINLGTEMVTIQGQLKYTTYQWNDHSMYLHVGWRLYHRQPSFAILNPRTDDAGFAFKLADLKGKGVYVGDLITLFNTEDAWWGEGDEKIWVDADSFPAHFGTGTEDYYGYAWARPEEFSHPFIAQPRGQGNFHPGMTVNMRQRILDVIPFQDSLLFDLECLHWVATPLDMSLTAFFYGLPGAFSLGNGNEQDVMKPLAFVKEDVIPPVFNTTGILEGEHLKFNPPPGLTMETQYFWPASTPFSNGGHVWMVATQNQQRADLEFWMTTDTIVNMEIGMTKAPDYAIVDLALNGCQLKRHNGYTPSGLGLERILFKGIRLKRGANQLTVVFSGKDKRAKPGLMAGVDYLRIKP